jgi:hypothetical protein
VPTTDQTHDETHDETEDEQVEEDFRSLMEGLRTTLPGVQLVTAFLLTVPMYDKYESLVHAERVAYYLAFGSALVASLLLMAPSSHQRLRSRHGSVARHSRRHLDAAVKITVVGSALFAVTIIAVAYLVASIVLSTTVAIAVSVVVGVACLWSWYWLPLVSFRQDD